MGDRSPKQHPIREAYRRAGMNRSQFQRAIGVAYSTIMNWEQGRTRPNADHLEKIAAVTGSPLSDLLGAVTPEPQASRDTYPALDEFLSQPVARRLTLGERRTLEGIVFHGVEPTVATFHAILVGLRMGERPSRRPSGKRR